MPDPSTYSHSTNARWPPQRADPAPPANSTSSSFTSVHQQLPDQYLLHSSSTISSEQLQSQQEFQLVGVQQQQEQDPNLVEVQQSAWDAMTHESTIASIPPRVPMAIPASQSLSADASLLKTMYENAAKLGLPENAVSLTLHQPKAQDSKIAEIMERLYLTIDHTFGDKSQLKPNWNTQIGLLSLWINEIYKEKMVTVQNC